MRPKITSKIYRRVMVQVRNEGDEQLAACRSAQRERTATFERVCRVFEGGDELEHGAN